MSPPITTASVKVMRSHDYCHFEVVLGIADQQFGFDIEAVDELRKEAARLADKAVAQYKIAKEEAARQLSEKRTRQYLLERIGGIRATAEGDRTVSEQAELKAFDDSVYEARRSYNYDDDWEDEEGS